MHRFLFLAFVLCVSRLFGQDLSAFNAERDKLFLPQLVLDEAMLKAAQFQAEYQVTRKKITSYHEDKKLSNVRKRVAQYGSTYRTIREHSFLIKSSDSVTAVLKNHFFRDAVFNKFYDKAAVVRIPSWRKGSDLVVLVIGKTFKPLPLFDDYQSDLRLKSLNGMSYDKAMEYMTRFNSKPGEIRYDVKLKENDSLFFVMNDVDWFYELFKLKKDGIAVDMMVKRQFACGEANWLEERGQFKGYSLGHWDADYLKKHAVVNDQGRLKCFLMVLPEELQPLDKEFNLLLLQDDRIIQYTEFYNVPFSDWELLEMPLKNASIAGETSIDSLFVSRTLKFKVPFEKDKYVFKTEDIKPLYDSLHLNRYSISSAEIRAFASVEGSTSHNIELQEARANSIVKVLEELQLDTIPQIIIARENWVEFYKDVKQSSHSEMADMTKEAIKYLLNTKGYSTEMETLLAPHRKALITLELSARSSSNSFESGRDQFLKMIAEENVNEAIFLQQELFRNFGKEREQDINDLMLKVPNESTYSVLHHNYLAHHGPDSSSVDQMIQLFSDYIGMNPLATEMKYNLCVLLLKKWEMHGKLEEQQFLLNSIRWINAQARYQTLSKVLMVNFYILDTREKMKMRAYDLKNKNLLAVKSIYDDSNLGQDETLRIARYLVFYLKESWAVQLLHPWAYELDVKEDLLFYYLNLTILNPGFTGRSEYRRAMLNAINLNKDRFCKMFKNASKEGVTFQLLEDPRLKEIYCSECTQ
jgi:hypothetical protein